MDLATGRCERVLGGHRHDVIAVAISPDGRRAASAALDNELRHWDLATGAAGHVLYDHEEHVVMVGRAYLSAPLGGRDDAGHSDAPAVLAFDPSGEVLWSAAREIIGWDVATGAERVRSTRRGWPIEAVVPGPGGLAFASDEAVGSWDPAKGSFTLLDVADERVTALAAVPGGGLAGGTRDGRVLTWEGTPGPGWAVHAGSVHRAVVAPGSRGGATLASDGGIRLWDLTSGRLVATLDHDLEAVRGALAFTTDGRALVTGGAGHLHRWDAATGAELDRADEPRAAARAPIAPNALLALPDGGVLAGLLGEGFRRWDAAGLTALEGRTSQISSITLAGDGGIAVTTGWFDPEPAPGPFSPFGDSRSVLQGWDLATGTLRWSVAGAGPPPGRLVGGVHFGFVLPVRGGVVTCAERDGTTLVLRDPATGASRRELEVPGLTGAHRLADGGLLLVTGEGDDRVCVRADPELDGLGTPVRVPAFAELLPLPSGRAALLRADDGLLLVSLADGTVTGRFAAAAPIITVAAGDDGRTVLAGDRAGRVHVLRAQGR